MCSCYATAGETSLSGTYDIIRIDLQQPEKYKTVSYKANAPTVG